MDLITLSLKSLLTLKLHEKYKWLKLHLNPNMQVADSMTPINPCQTWSPIRSKSMGIKQDGDFCMCSVGRLINQYGISISCKNFQISSTHTTIWELGKIRVFLGHVKANICRNSLAVQWLGLCTSTARGHGFDRWPGKQDPATWAAQPKKK